LQGVNISVGVAFLGQGYEGYASNCRNL